MQGTTLRRRIEAAVHAPHGDGGTERFDPEFAVATRCRHCGKVGMGPRKHLRDAVLEHEKQCPARRTKQSADVLRTQILYPRQ